MTPQEQELVNELFHRLAQLENNPRDPSAESPHANAIIGLAWEIKHRAQRMEARRDNLFTRVLPNSGLTSARSN